MSTRRLDSAPLPQGVADGGSETSVIAALARSFFRGESVPDPGCAAIPSPASRPDGLNGGFPIASSNSHPDVHPALEKADSPTGRAYPSAFESVPHAGRPDSGAEEGGRQGSHPFGEPRYLASPVPGALSPGESGRGLSGKHRAPGQLEGIPGIQQGSVPEFYFLQAADLDKPTTAFKEPPARIPARVPGQFDVHAIRRDFPALHQTVNGHPLIWLDNAATTQKPSAVIDATSGYYSRDNSNIHRAAHALSERSTRQFEEAREKVRGFLGAADRKEIIFVRGTTEGINLVAQSYGRRHIGKGDEIILSQMEHHANIVPWQLLAAQTGAVIKVIPMNDRGELILEEFVRLLGPRTKFVSITHVSNALGTVNPVEEIIPLAHARGVPVLVDGAQSTPHMPVNVTALGADFYVFSGHKIFGPTGIGALYGKASLLEAMDPWQGGGHMIRDVSFERTVYQDAPEKFEAGTPDIAGVIGLGAAIDYLEGIGLPALAAYEHSLLEYATEVLAEIPGLRPIGTAANKASVLSFVIPGLSNDLIARHLDRQGIAVRAGHHCALPAQRRFGVETTVRPSLAFYNTHEEVDILARALRTLPRH